LALNFPGAELAKAVGKGLKKDEPRSESPQMALERVSDDPLKIYPVSDLVNSPKADDPRCIEPVRNDRDIFERQR
jgi:hypothetical protein